MATGYPDGRDRRGRVHTAVQPCRDCQRPMRWATNLGGTRIPLDVEPSDAGDNVLLQQSSWALTIRVTNRQLREELLAFTQAHAAGEDINPALRRLYTCHWETCPNRSAPRERADLA